MVVKYSPEDNRIVKEKQLLGKVLSGKCDYQRVEDYAEQFKFVMLREATLFAAIKSLHDRGATIGTREAIDELRRMGVQNADSMEGKKYLLEVVELAVGFVQADWPEEPGEAENDTG